MSVHDRNLKSRAVSIFKEILEQDAWNISEKHGEVFPTVTISDGSREVELAVTRASSRKGVTTEIHDWSKVSENESLRREIVRLEDVLVLIAGGDDPCKDEDKLRGWAYDAVALKKSSGDLS